MTVSYSLDDRVKWGDGSAELGFFMGDIAPEKGLGTGIYNPKDRYFLEAYAPTNLEFDRYQFVVTLSVVGAAGSHRLFANTDDISQQRDLTAHRWSVVYPDYFVTSSFYLHLVPTTAIRSSSTCHTNHNIVTYARSGSPENLEAACRRVAGWAREYENTYGEYAHAAGLILFLTSVHDFVPPAWSLELGQEYAGAIVIACSDFTSSSCEQLLKHEVFHMWFGRGIAPAAGRDGWIDEMLAHWAIEGGNVSREPLPPRNLASPSLYSRFTPQRAYFPLWHHIKPYLLVDRDGFEKALAQLYQQRRRGRIRSAEFEEFLLNLAWKPACVEKALRRYVHGDAVTPCLEPTPRK